MEALSTGAGLAALGFWTFIAACVAAGVWDSIRKRDAQHETLRRAIESGQPISQELTETLLMVSGNSKDLARDLWASGLIILSIAPALAIFGWLMSLSIEPKLLPIMLSVGGLLACLGIGFLIVSRLISRRDEQSPQPGIR